MAEMIQLLKAVSGPALAVLIWIVVMLWRKCKRLEEKIESLYERLLKEQKQDSLTSIRMIQAHLEGKGDAVAQSYIDFLTKQAEELRREVEEMRRE